MAGQGCYHVSLGNRVGGGAQLTCFRVRKGQEAHRSVQEAQSEVRIENWLLSKFFCL